MGHFYPYGSGSGSKTLRAGLTASQEHLAPKKSNQELEKLSNRFWYLCPAVGESVEDENVNGFLVSVVVPRAVTCINKRLT